MAATDAKVILAAASCDECFTPNQYAANLVMIGLLRQIALSLNPMAVTDAKSLLASAQAPCDASCGTQFPLIIIGLLRLIAINGAAPITQINVPGPPSGNPPTFSNFVVDSNGRTWTFWGGAWH